MPNVPQTSQVLIVGSGAGGGTLAWALAVKGVKVVVMEKGPTFTRTDLHHDEIEMSRHDMFVPSVSEDPHILVEYGAAADPAPTNLGWTASCVGGGTMHMGGCFYRFHADDFRLASRLGEYEAISDWPYCYEDLEPYYSKAETLIGVSGAPAGSPYELFRSRPLPMPPLPRNGLAVRLEDGCRGLGLNPFVTPRAMNSISYDGRPACSLCHICGGFGCHTGARGSVPETVLNRAIATGNCILVDRAMVRRITTDSLGRVDGCIWIDVDGAEHRFIAEAVAVCCSAVESARLLLLSSSMHYPEGLANRNGLVGRYLQFHGVSNGRATYRNCSGLASVNCDTNSLLGVSIADFYFVNDGSLSFGKGGLLCFDLTPFHPVAIAKRLARSDRGDIIWGAKLKRRITEQLFEGREVEFEVFQDCLPNDDTRVELDCVEKDRWGLPVARMTVRESSHHALAGKYLVERGLEILSASGANNCTNVRAGAVSKAMVHGTCRAARSAARGVVNQFCQSFDVPNLFVVDGSFMPTSGGAPSTLTIIANALRVADYMASSAGSIVA